MAQNLRELIAEKSLLLRDVDSLGPAGAAKELVELSSILSSLNAEIADKHYWYNMKRVELIGEHKTASKARVYAEASQEWKDWQDRLVQRDSVVEMIRALKYYLKGAESEYKESKF